MAHLTNEQIDWASRHDWFVARVGNTIEVVDRWINVNTGERGTDFIIWDKSFRALRDWAGY